MPDYRPIPSTGGGITASTGVAAAAGVFTAVPLAISTATLATFEAMLEAVTAACEPRALTVCAAEDVATETFVLPDQ